MRAAEAATRAAKAATIAADGAVPVSGGQPRRRVPIEIARACAALN